MSNIIKLLAFLILTASCSESDQGLNFSSISDRLLKTGIGSCSLVDTGVPDDGSVYTSETETKITNLFNKYVTPLQVDDPYELSGQVKYLDWLLNIEDKKSLCEVVNTFKYTNPALFTRAEKMSFYINAYNVFTIELILRNYLNLDKGENRDKSKYKHQKSIRNIDDLYDKVWDNFLWQVGGADLSLNAIEKEILIPMGDARVHFAVNCASKGCPPLRNEAFTAARLSEQLDEMSTFFVSSPAYNTIELEDEDVAYDPENEEYFYEISAIFYWYAVDFKNDTSKRYGSVQKFLIYHLNKTDEQLGFPKKDLKNTKVWSDDYSAYDWSLNEVL